MIILGVAVGTSEHHAAALVVDGQVVAAAEEERFNRVKHYGRKLAAKSGGNLINTPGLSVDDVFCDLAANYVLKAAGLTLADVDYIAVNALPSWLLDTGRACVVEGRYVYVPHHLSHAALAARTSPHRVQHVLTVDGRGEFETAALFVQTSSGDLTRTAELPAGEGRSIGGAFETVTRVIGLGAHGQGQTMALAAFEDGDPMAFPDAYAIDGFDTYRLDEVRLQHVAQSRLSAARDPRRERQRLAADVQAATERALLALAAQADAAPQDGWAIAGGVALNCCANSKLRDAIGGALWVPSAAHDAGTALGAALEAAHLLGEPKAKPLTHAGLGPALRPGEIEAALRSSGGREVCSGNGVEQIAVERLMRGETIGWVSGRMEYGPRALGHRSIVAHPGHPGAQDRVNGIKSRQRWRPFGPSVLADHAAAWFGDTAFGPFMTFTTNVRDEKQADVAGVVHVDGTTRPQMVDERANPAWCKLIELFHDASGVPMVLNTSFNGRGEPIVANAADALASARKNGLDAVVLEDRFIDLSGA